MRILVLGASGYIGTHLVERLRGSGHAIRAVSRNRATLEARDWSDVEIVEADALDPASLAAACENIEVAYYLVHSMGAGEDFARLDRAAARNFRQAAEQAGVRRIIYMGGVQPGGRQSEHLASRAETGEILRDGAIPVTELRAGIIVGAGSAAFEVIRDLALHLRIMVTPRWVRSSTRPIALDDLLGYLVAVLDLPGTADGTYDVGGPETLTYQQMLQQFAEVAGRRVLIIPVPVLSPRLSSYWLDLITAVPANVARPLVDGLEHDLIPDDREIRALIPTPLHTYREAITAALRAEREEAVPARWTEGSLAYRAYRPEVSYYSKRTRVRAASAAPPEVLWRTVASVGGRRGWPAYHWLWRIRAAADRAIGGVGMRRGRRHPVDVRAGDTIDWWRVVAAEPGKSLTLLAEMRSPGAAVLEFEIDDGEAGGSQLTTTAYFHPAGVIGLLYWYALTFVHGRIFARLAENLAREAEEAARDPSSPS